ncbi:MAG: hypothetical protein ACRD2D_06375, partial [Terriglobales bacterium]
MPFTAVAREVSASHDAQTGQSLIRTRIQNIAVDACGRVRREIISDSDPGAARDPRIYIYDTLAHASYELWPETLVARVFSDGRPQALSPASSPVSHPRHRLIVPTLTNTSLGKGLQDGFEIIGTRATVEYPATGTTPAHASITDNWFSPRLGWGLRSRTSDSVVGYTFSAQLGGIAAKAPDPPLFRIPSGYRIVRVSPDPDPRIAALLSDAVLRLGIIPGPAQPSDRLDVASVELSDSRDPAMVQAGISNLKLAFQQALSLPQPLTLPGLPDLSFDLQGAAQQRAVQVMADLDPAAALAMAQASNLHGWARESLFDAILNALARSGGNPGPAPAVDVLDLIEACVTESGRYPFAGVEALLRNAGLDLDTRTAILHSAYLP